MEGKEGGWRGREGKGKRERGRGMHVSGQKQIMKKQYNPLHYGG